MLKHIVMMKKLLNDKIIELKIISCILFIWIEEVLLNKGHFEYI